MALAERAPERMRSPKKRRIFGWVGAVALLVALVLAWVLPWDWTPYGAGSAPDAAFNGAGRAVLEGGINRYWNGAWRDPGQTLGPFTVVRGRVYAPLASGRGIEAISAQNGRLIWRTRLVGVDASAPVVAGGRIFVAVGGGARVEALSARRGRRLWSRAIPGRGPSAEALDGGRLAVARGSRLWMLMVGNGRPAAELKTRSGLGDPRLLCTRGRLYEWGAGGIQAWSGGSSPARLWSAGLTEQPGSLVVGPGGVYVAEDGPREAIAAYASRTGRLLWRAGLGPSLGGVLGPLVYYRGGIYLGATGSDLIYALRAANGRIRWETDIAPDGVAAAPLPVNGNLLVADTAGVIWDLNLATGYTLSTREAPGPVGRMRPYLVGHSLYLETIVPKAGLYVMHLGLIAPGLSGWTKPL